MNLIPWKTKPDKNIQRGEIAMPGLRDELDHLIDRFFNYPFATSLADTFRGWGGGLRTDLVESDDEVTVRAELPGVDPKDVEISVANGILTISGEKKAEHEEKRQDYHYAERQFGSFHRSIQLPPYVDADKVDAAFKHGVLTVTMAKQPDAKPRKIKVNMG
jgi:HSP20 family protein